MAQFPSIINSGSLIFAPKDVAPAGQGELLFSTSLQRLYYICACLTTWTSANAMNVGGECIRGTGTQTAALAFGGYRPPLVPSPYISNCTEEYDGTSWTAGGAMITARRNHGADGTQVASFAAGGCSPTLLNNTEEYDGSTWTAGGALITARFSLGGSGTQNAGLVFGGSTPAVTSNTEEYDGSAWASGGSLPATTSCPGAAGTQNAGLAVGGTPANTNCVLHYDGAAWSAGTNIPVGHPYDMRVAGLQTAALAHAVSRCTQTYDGSAWTTVGFSGIPGAGGDNAGTTSAAVSFGGSPSAVYTCTCEYATGNPIGGVYVQVRCA